MLSSSIPNIPKVPVSSRIERMCASRTTNTFSTLAHLHSRSRRFARFQLASSRITFLSHYTFRNPNFTARFSTAIHQPSFEVSWQLEDSASDGCGGWAIIESPVPKKQKGVSRVLVLCIGTSVAVLLAALVYFSHAGKGFRLAYGNPFRVRFFSSAPKVIEENVAEPSESLGSGVASEVGKPDLSDPPSEVTTKWESTKPPVLPITLDSNQEEALSLLKKLKVGVFVQNLDELEVCVYVQGKQIIEDDEKACGLCTRREYARWLVRANSLLERNPKHKIVPLVSLSGSTIPAYDDVALDDPDFESIQALAEAGILLSKLSEDNSSVDGGFKFYPERFVSRHDLIDWRGQLEYDLRCARNLEMSKIKLDLLDTKDINSDTSPGLFTDLFAGERSLHRKVFGQVRRIQPNKPATKAHAAVALTSGRMAEAIHTELLRIQTEESSRLAAIEEIKRELLDRGEIRRLWDEKMEGEKIHEMEANQSLLEAIDELEKGRNLHQKECGENSKKKAAVDCQKQLLNQLELEVKEMTERLVSERAELIAVEDNLHVVSGDLQSKKEGMLDAKSWLEAELEALRILRSWIEDEAKKNQARANVLKEVGRRWRWSEHY